MPKSETIQGLSVNTHSTLRGTRQMNFNRPALEEMSVKVGHQVSQQLHSDKIS